MDPLSFLVGASLVAANVHALAALVAGFRTRDAAAVSKLSRRCAWSAGGLALVSLAGLAVSLRTEVPRDDDPANRAIRLAVVISASMNTAAFALVGSALPLAAAAILAGYRRRLTRA